MLLSALADLGAEHQIASRSLQRLATHAARGLGADVLTIRLLDGHARWLVLAAGVGMPKTLRVELRRIVVDAPIGRALVRRGRRVVWAHPAPARVPTIWLLGTEIRSTPGRGCRLLVSCPIEVARARTAG